MAENENWDDDLSDVGSPKQWAVDELVTEHEKLGPNAQQVLLAVAKRLAIGAAFGDFDRPMDLKKEKREELIDALIYGVADSLELGR